MERPTSPDHLSTLEQAIALVSRTVAEFESQALQQHGEFVSLSMRQIVYLETIAQMERPTFSDLARQLGLARPSVTAIVDKLIRLGYVQKIQSDHDRRSYFILLTEKGQALSQAHQKIHRAMAEQLTRRLDQSELEQLVSLLGKVIGQG